MEWTTKMKVYAGLSAAGLILPWIFNIQLAMQHGGAFSLMDFLAGGFANPAASSLSVDLTIGAIAAMIWMVAEGRRLGMRFPWIYVPLTLMIAFAFALPLFLLLREVKLQQAAIREVSA